MAQAVLAPALREQGYIRTADRPGEKIRTIELSAGHPRCRGKRSARHDHREQRRAIERKIAAHARTAYERTITADHFGQAIA
jgi:hypothetical protein